MMSEIVRQGRAAWARLKQHKRSWSDWVLVGYAVLEGRKAAMYNAGASRPAGKGYALATGIKPTPSTTLAR